MARILGIDIAQDRILATWVVGSFRSLAVERYASAPIAPSFDDESRVVAIRDAVRSLVASSPRPADTIVAHLDGTEASLRALELPVAAAKQLDQVLPFELESLLPFDVADALVDHQPISRTPTTLKILACAVPKSKIEARLDRLRAYGADPRELAVGAAALDGLVPLVPALAEPGPIAVVHLDAETTDICILESGRPVLVRTVDEGVDALEQRRGHLLAGALKRTLAAHRASGGAPPTHAYVSGRPDVVSSATSWLTETLEVETSVLPLPVAPGADSIFLPDFGRALALAGRPLGKGRRLNLRRGPFAPPRAIGGLREHAKLLGISAAFVFLSFLFSVGVRKSVLETEHAALVTRLESETHALFGQRASTAEAARRLMNGQDGVQDPLPRFDAFDALDLLSTKISPDIRHTTERLAIEMDDQARDGRIELSGTVPSITDRDTIAIALETHECVQGIERGPTSPVVGDTRQNYRMEVSLQCPGERPLETEGSSSRRRRATRPRNEAR